jgi:hypothetical protein
MLAEFRVSLSMTENLEMGAWSPPFSLFSQCLKEEDLSFERQENRFLSRTLKYSKDRQNP